MLKQADNELLTRTGPGTRMGGLFRRYWLPALLAEEVAEPDGVPVRVELLSEKMLAFRDSSGQLGLVDEFCAHRGVSLWFGRNEENGLRCPYHGWKYDTKGNCVEVPSEPPGSPFCKRVKLKSYPLIERGGVIWVYMGPPEHQPPPPEYEFAMVPDSARYVSKRLQECNWLQAMEGGIDSSHVSFLHRGGLKTDPLFKGAGGNQYNLNDLSPVFEVEDVEGGLLIAARRNAEPGHYYWRITPWLMPCFTMVPPRGEHPVHGHFWIPINDTTCWAWSFDYHANRDLSEDEVTAMRNGKGIHTVCIPGTYIPVQNKSNDYLIDRASQKSGETYSGVHGIAIQDSSLQESMGPIQDRTREMLTSTDRGIVQARRKLMAAANELATAGTAPQGVQPQSHHVRSAALVMPAQLPFVEGAQGALKAEPGKAHASV